MKTEPAAMAVRISGRVSIRRQMPSRGVGQEK
jgi:hypothetical protein